MIYGNILHNIVEEAVLSSDVSNDALRKMIDHALRSQLEDLYAAGISEDEATRHLEQFIPQIQRVHSQFLIGTPQTQIEIDSVYHRVAISKILGVEQEIPSPMWGLKGKEARHPSSADAQ
jgi:hypothetical protein